MHSDVESASHISSPELRDLQSYYGAPYVAATGEDLYQWGLGSTTSGHFPITGLMWPRYTVHSSQRIDPSIASDPAYLDQERFDFRPVLGTARLEDSPDQVLRTSLPHSSVASFPPQHSVHHSSPYGETQRGRSFSDGAAVTSNLAQQSSYLLNNVTSGPASIVQRPFTYAVDQEAFDAPRRCSVALADTNADSELSFCQQLTVQPLRNPTSTSLKRPSTPPNHDRSPLNPYHPKSPSLGRIFSPSISPSPPDLFSNLSFPPLSPPTQSPDITTSKLRRQDSRFPGDLYTPIYTRNEGPLREGWCGFCRPGRWLVLKNSAFWYDKCFGHGICATTGAKFEEPVDMRITYRGGGYGEGWEGRCGICGEWIMLVGGKRSGVPWFRHAYKVRPIFFQVQSLDYADGIQCHTHTKVPSTSKTGEGTIPTRASKPTNS